jgi:hypothetical protein
MSGKEAIFNPGDAPSFTIAEIVRKALKIT